MWAAHATRTRPVPQTPNKLAIALVAMSALGKYRIILSVPPAVRSWAQAGSNLTVSFLKRNLNLSPKNGIRDSNGASTEKQQIFLSDVRSQNIRDVSYQEKKSFFSQRHRNAGVEVCKDYCDQCQLPVRSHVHSIYIMCVYALNHVSLPTFDCVRHIYDGASQYISKQYLFDDMHMLRECGAAFSEAV